MDRDNKEEIFHLIVKYGHARKLYEIWWNDYVNKDSIIDEFGKFMKSTDKYWLIYKARERYNREQLAEVVATESSNWKLK